MVSAQFISESQKLRDGFFNGGVQIMVGVQLQEWALLVQLLALVGFEFFEALVQELQQHKHAVGVDEELGEVDELIDAVGFEML